MKKLLLTASLVALATPSYAAMPAYLSLGVGLTDTMDSDWDDSVGDQGTIGIDNSANFSAAIGASFLKNTRTELEVSYRKAGLSDISLDGVGSASLNGDLTTWGFLVNGYYDFPLKSKISPYLSAGIGVAHHKGTIDAVGGLGTPGTDSTDTVFAYQVGLGASYAITEKASLWAGYRYLGSADPNFDDISAEYHANELRAGVRFNF